ncbi:MAG: acyl-CoA thioesterase [Deltaproteobacteria bacterium]|nr:acyl-CoA thioesterase [Deltaproteobacteria bacterium]
MDGNGWFEMSLRVRYKDTDRMGVVYYGNYLTFFEVGRAELMRHLGYAYSRLEAEGYNLVVAEASARYHRNVGYDSMVVVRTRIAEVKGASVRFDYRVLAEDGGLLVTGHTLHACINDAQKPIRLPAEVKRLMERAMKPPEQPA